MILTEATKIEKNNNNHKQKMINKIENNKQFNNSKNTPNNIASTNYSTLHQQQSQQLDIARENRLSEIISLYTKGLTQSEIAEKMGVNQSTVSRDIQYLQEQAKKNIWKYLNEDILFEYLRYIVGNNEISKKLWEIIQNENTSIKEKINALSLLNQSYTKRLEILMEGPESFRDVKKSFSEIEDIEMMERNPMLKLSSKLGQLRLPFSRR